MLFISRKKQWSNTKKASIHKYIDYDNNNPVRMLLRVQVIVLKKNIHSKLIGNLKMFEMRFNMIHLNRMGGADERSTERVVLNCLEQIWWAKKREVKRNKKKNEILFFQRFVHSVSSASISER